MFTSFTHLTGLKPFHAYSTLTDLLKALDTLTLLPFFNTSFFLDRQILLNYACYHPEVGYSQGMSDLLASILSTVQDEVDSFWCFVGLMERSLFVTSPKDDSMDCQLVRKRNLKLNALKHICSIPVNISKFLHTTRCVWLGIYM